MSIFIAGTGYIPAGTEAPSTLRRELRRADEFISLAVQAGYAVLGPEPLSLQSGRHGLVLGTAYGPMQTNFDVLDQVVHHEQTSPTLFSHSVFNAAAGYLSRIFILQGSVLTITDFAFPFFQALQQGSIAITSGQLESCLVLQVETYSDLLNDARSRIIGNGANHWHAGAVAWLLTGESGEGNKEICAINVQLQPSSEMGYLVMNEKLTCASHARVIDSPLGAAVAVTDIISNAPLEDKTICIAAPYGSIELSYRCCNPLPERE
jgi:hypothetical protein